MVSRATVSDTARFQCVATNEAGDHERDFNVVVHGELAPSRSLLRAFRYLCDTSSHLDGFLTGIFCSVCKQQRGSPHTGYSRCISCLLLGFRRVVCFL